jgi:integrase
VVALYLTERTRHDKPATLARRVASISQAHQAAGHEPPTRSACVRLTLQGIRRAKGVAQSKKAPVLTADVRAMVTALPPTLLGKRDRAVLLLGYASTLRRAALAAVTVNCLEWTDAGLVLCVERDKTDQEGCGRKIGIPTGRYVETCPVRALRAWLDAAGITEGPVFRPMNNKGQVKAAALAPKTVALIVQRAAARIGKDPKQFGGHSLRSGLITQTAISAPHISEVDLAKHTGHRSMAVLRGYIPDGSLFRANPAAEAGL